jgi:hypothetical protein
MATLFTGISAGASYAGTHISPDFNGMWGNRVWFVDYDNGQTGNSGDRPDDAQKNLQTILDKAGEWDTIYIRPRDPDSTGGDPQAILPASTSNWDIPYTLHGLSIIGTNPGNSKASANATRLQGSATVNATPVVYAKAPYLTFENITFRRGGSTLTGLKIGTGSTPYSFSSTLNNCLFWKIGSTATAGALNLNSWHNNILNSTFEECYCGIYLDSAQSNPVGTVIKGTAFVGLGSTISADIYCSNSTLSTLIDDCRFTHTIPTGGATFGNLYINFVGASTGLFCNSFMGAADPTIATNTTLNGVLYSEIAVADGATNGGHMVAA